VFIDKLNTFIQSNTTQVIDQTGIKIVLCLASAI